MPDDLDDMDDEGEELADLALCFSVSLDSMGAKVVMELLELMRERVVATPLTSLSVSLVGSRLTNSFCSNWTTT